MIFRVLLIILTVLAPATGAYSQKAPASPAPQAQGSSPAVPEASAPYDEQLSELARILGAVEYLRNLCMPGEDNGWRDVMQRLLASETANEPARRAMLTAAFNRGYRGFAAIHVTCTPAATMAERQYRNEGATLAAEIASRFGN